MDIYVASLFLIPGLIMYNVNMIYGCGSSDVICKNLYIKNNKINVMTVADGHGHSHGG
jgi:hypothetical protein